MTPRSEDADGLDVSYRGSRSISIAPHTAQSVHRPTAGVDCLGSMNYLNRKREADRIERENNAFAKRLFARDPVIQKSRMDREYSQMRQIKDRLKKHGKLPPLAAGQLS